MKAIDLLESSSGLLDKLQDNTRYFREAIAATGLKILPSEHPIVPVMIGDAALAAKMADRLLEKGIYVIGFSFPVVPKGQARIRTQVSAAHPREDLEFAATQFGEVAKDLGVVA